MPYFINIGKAYAIASRDRHGLPYLEIGYGMVHGLTDGNTRSVAITYGWWVRPFIRWGASSKMFACGPIWVVCFP